MTIGTLITFNSLLVYFLDPIKNLINLQPEIQTAVVAADRLGEILDLEAEKTEKESHKLSPVSLAGDIEIKNVNFRYGTRKLVLEDVSLSIKKGQKVAFVGESGSGKTTLSKLLLHLYTAESGTILINGNNIEDIQLEYFWRHIFCWYDSFNDCRWWRIIGSIFFNSNGFRIYLFCFFHVIAFL